jgi:hypothetical protein
MKKLKVSTIIIITAFTFMAILYLIYQAERMQEYTIARNDGRTCFVVYSSMGGDLKDGKTVKEVLDYAETFAVSAGYDSINLGVNKTATDEEMRKKIIDNLKQNKRYIILDINATGIIINKDTVLLKLSSKNPERYKDNLEYANKIKKNVAEKSIKVNILSEKKFTYNQDLGYRAFYLDMSNKITLNEAQQTLSSMLESLVE